MTDSLISDSRGRPGDDPIFTINAEANRRRAAGESIINASLGALLDDDGKLAVMPSVFESFRSVAPEQAAAYAPIAGDRAFLDAVIEDTFDEGPLRDGAVAVATPGGTGALLNALMNFLEPGQALYTSSYYWSPYRIIAGHNKRGIRTFRMFADDGRFDVEAFEDGLRALVEEQGRALVILNFPCHNPTGYSLDEEEWRGVADALYRCSEHGPVALLLDLAYAKFGSDESGVWREALAPITDRVTLLCAWTASKSFAQYGARVGALIATTPDDAKRTAIANAISYTCRGSWSNCNHMGLLAIARILGNAQLRRDVDAERANLVTLVRERMDAFNDAAQRAGLRYPRYEGGFFVSVFADNAFEAAKLIAERGVFVVPMDGALRIALCSVPKADIARLVDEVASGIARSSETVESNSE